MSCLAGPKPRFREAVTAGWRPAHVSMPNTRGNIPLVVRLWIRASAVGHVGDSINSISDLESVQACG